MNKKIVTLKAVAVFCVSILYLKTLAGITKYSVKLKRTLLQEIKTWTTAAETTTGGCHCHLKSIKLLYLMLIWKWSWPPQHGFNKANDNLIGVCGADILHKMCFDCDALFGYVFCVMFHRIQDSSMTLKPHCSGSFTYNTHSFHDKLHMTLWGGKINLIALRFQNYKNFDEHYIAMYGLFQKWELLVRSLNLWELSQS